MPPAISGVVGKKCIVVADVTQDALDLDSITFHVANSEIINVPDTVPASTSTSKIPITAEKSTLPRSSDEAIQPSPQSKHSENTPAKDIIEETDQDSEE